MKKWVSTLILLFVFSLSQGAFAADWRPVEGVKDTFWNAEGLKLISDDKGIVEGDLVVVSLKRPVNPDFVKKISEAETNPVTKADMLKATHEVRNYCFSLKYAAVSYAGGFLISADGKPVAEQANMTEFVKIPEKGQGADAIVQVYQYLLSEQKAGRIK